MEFTGAVTIETTHQISSEEFIAGSQCAVTKFSLPTNFKKNNFDKNVSRTKRVHPRYT